MNARNHDEWTVERWRIDPRPRTLADVEERQLAEEAPPLWKDLTAASIAAVLLWGAAVALLG